MACGLPFLIACAPGPGSPQHDQPMTTIPSEMPPIDDAAVSTPTSTPLPDTPLPTASPTPSAQGGVYTVQPGDTLWAIAVRLNTSVEALIVANPGLNPDMLYPGDRIVVPPSVANFVPPTPVSSPGDRPLYYPYISGIGERVVEVYKRGQELGNRPGVFSKVGDSITANDVFLVPIGTGDYNLRDYAYLEPVIQYYSQEVARDRNSFANPSLAAASGWSAGDVLDPDAADSLDCLPGEAPLVCEYRVVRPSVALIMLGTNDVRGTSVETYAGWMRQIVEITIEMGVIPIVSTIPPFHEDGMAGRVQQLNSVIVDLTQEYGIPLWDYWAALNGLPNDGLWDDGVHPSWAVPADFTQGNLLYGMTARNLTALQALDAVWRVVLASEDSGD